jgi:hypothetical protein
MATDLKSYKGNKNYKALQGIDLDEKECYPNRCGCEDYILKARERQGHGRDKNVHTELGRALNISYKFRDKALLILYSSGCMVELLQSGWVR